VSFEEMNTEHAARIVRALHRAEVAERNYFGLGDGNDCAKQLLQPVPCGGWRDSRELQFEATAVALLNCYFRMNVSPVRGSRNEPSGSVFR